MYKHPLKYTKEDLQEIMFKPMRVHIGPTNNDQVTETLNGQIISCSLAANSPNQPANFELLLENGMVRSFNFFEAKAFEDI